MSLRFAANISLLFTEVPVLERPAAAKAAGFDAIESWWPFPTGSPPRGEADAFVAAVTGAGVRLEALNFFGGDLPGGDRGVLSIPDRAAEFRDSVAVLTDIAAQTGCTRFNALYGVRVPGVAPAEQDELATVNLAAAAQAVAPLGGTVLVEPLAEGENGAYPLTSPDGVLAVIDRVRDQAGPGNLAFLADFYQLARNGFGWRAVIDGYLPRFGHVQIADSPGRHQPGTGTIAFGELFAALAAAGYPGYVGIEYRPLGRTEDSLAWLPRADRAEKGRA